MGLFLNPGNENFREILNAPIYVNKSGLLAYTNKVKDTPQKFICSSRPRRFGKSYTAEMLAAYYSRGCHSDDLFHHLDIAREVTYKDNLNKYNVIHLDI